jgi:flagellar protein FlbD
VNSDLIKFVEQSPDTTVTLLSGEKIVVLEKPGDVIARIVAFRRAVLQDLCSTWDASSLHGPILRSSESSGNEPKR